MYFSFGAVTCCGKLGDIGALFCLVYDNRFYGRVLSWGYGGGLSVPT
jgi:hypothetical protein